MSPLLVSLIAFAIILAGVFAGALLRRALPKHHLADDAKDVVRLGIGLIGTIAALVLGLLIASAKSSYDTQSGQVQHITADVVLLDQLLSQYGPQARPIRERMRQAVGPRPLVERLWRQSDAASASTPFAATSVSQDAFARVGETDAANRRSTLSQGACNPGIDGFGTDALGAIRTGWQFDSDAVFGRAGILAGCHLCELCSHGSIRH